MTVQEVVVSDEIIAKLRSSNDTLIFSGYIAGYPDVRLFSDGTNYAAICVSPNGTECCISGENVAFAQAVCDLPFVRGVVKFCAVGDRLFDYLSERYGASDVSRCGYYVYDGTPFTHNVENKIVPIAEEYAQAVSDGTFYHADVDEIKQCLRLRPSACIVDDGNPVCWCLVHREGSLGMLYTVPDHRHRGLALDVMTALCQALIARGEKPFAYIVDGNQASISLAAKYNLQKVGHASYFSAVIVK